MSHDIITVGIAGLGRSGWDIHARLLAELPDQYRVAAVLDADAERRQEAVDQFACQTYTETEFEALLANDDIDLIVNALPSFLHTSGSIQALAAGRHVVCEKPMATSLPDADSMVEAAQKSDKILTIFHQRRYQPEFKKIQEVIASGVLGRIVQIDIRAVGFSRRWDWQTLQKFGGGSLNNTGPHFLDHALELFGEGYPEVVFSQLDRTLTLGDADDHVKLLFKGEGKPTVDIEISSCSAFGAPLWNIKGTSGGLSGTPSELTWKWIDWDAAPARTLSEEPTPGRSYNRDGLELQEETWTAEGSPSGGFADFYRDLYATIRDGAPLVISPEQIRRVIWLQEEAHRLAPLDAFVN